MWGAGRADSRNRIEPLTFVRPRLRHFVAAPAGVNQQSRTQEKLSQNR